MIALWDSHDTVVGVARLRAATPDAVAARHRVEALLAGASLRPPGLPHPAVLCVRKLRTRMAWRAGVPARGSVQAGWEAAARTEMERLARGAARPALGPVPASVEAVLFSDRGELLACAALDWLAGSLASNWWWKPLLRGAGAGAWLAREWARSPEFVPAAVEILARAGRAIEFALRLPDGVAIEVLGAVLRAHGLPSWAAPVAFQMAEGAAPFDAFAAVLEPPRDRLIARMDAPWHAWAPEASAAGLPIPARLLLACALLLRRAPAVARSSRFAARMEEWLHAQPAPLSGMPEPAWPQGGPGAVADATDFVPGEAGYGVAPEAVRSAGPSEAAAAVGPIAEQAGEPDEGLETASAGQEAPASGVCGAKPVLNDEVRERAMPPGTNPVIEAMSGAPVEKAADAAAAEVGGDGASEEANPLPAAPVDTLMPRMTAVSTLRRERLASPVESDFAGTFFLLNAALFLDLYGDFTSPQHPGLELSIWDFIALLGARFTRGALRKDPAWALLAALAGRDAGEDPDAHFEPAGWSAPPQWFEALPELRARKTRAAGQAWIHWVAAYLRARLTLATGRVDAAGMLCARPARIALTSTHVDVFFALNDHPIEIRLAGLDRDPGWIPSAGRYVAFHFD